MLHTVAVHGYRSLREVTLTLGRLTVITGANGTGKSSLYAALHLLSETATGSLIGSLARTGGLESVLWAGPEHITARMLSGEVAVQGTGKRFRPVSLMLGFTTEDLGYLIDLGLPVPSPTMFTHDPVIKREAVWSGPIMRPAAMLVRRANRTVSVRDRTWRKLADEMSERDSILGELSDPDRTPELLALRRTVRGWRFHDGFRTDPAAPARQPQVATWTPVMSHDGGDFVPAVQTVRESAFGGAFDRAVAGAFPGGRVDVAFDRGRAELQFRQEGLLRALSASELSDGTLRYLLLATALCSPRPASLLVLNEPETSLHPDVLPGLADLIAATAQRTQIVVVSHSAAIVDRLRVAFDAAGRVGPAAPNGGDAEVPATAAGDQRTPTLFDADRRHDMPSDADDEPRLDDNDHDFDYDLDDDLDDVEIVPGEGFVHHHLDKRLGETIVEGQGLLTRPTWDWGTR